MADVTKIGDKGESQIFHYDSEGGDSGTKYVLRRFSWKVDEKAPTDEEIDEWVDDNFPSTRCHHSYDCCGHWYNRPADWLDVTDKYAERERLILIRQSAHQNI